MRFVGRERELALLREAWERVKATQSCELVTVVGDAGVGKSRLTAEVLAPLDARIVRGRCLPYGDGITYWPVIEVLEQLDVAPPQEAAAPIRALLGETETATSAGGDRLGVPQDARARSRRAAAGRARRRHPLGRAGAARPPRARPRCSPRARRILLLCLARPELLERRPDWPVTVRLEPLGDDRGRRAAREHASPAQLRERIARAAGGNPLFAEELVAMAGDAGRRRWSSPPTLNALLGARLDRLEPAERARLERGAVEGELFHRGAVVERSRREPAPVGAASSKRSCART